MPRPALSFGYITQRQNPLAQRIWELRRERWTGKQIAADVGVFARHGQPGLRDNGLNKLKNLHPAGGVAQ